MTWEQARQKIQSGTSYRDTVRVPFGDPETGELESIELTHRLLTENEYWDVAASIDNEEVEQDDPDDEVEKAQQTVQRLQGKENLTEYQERELEDALETVQRNQGQLISNLGEETFNALLRVGKTCLAPSETDVDQAFNMPAPKQEQRFNFIPNTRDQVREAVKLEMEEMVQEQPYLIKFIVGLKAWSASQSVVGQTDVDSENPDPNA
jgi:hypothetical protein